MPKEGAVDPDHNFAMKYQVIEKNDRHVQAIAKALKEKGARVAIMARDAESFRQSRTQVAADIARAVSLGRRGM